MMKEIDELLEVTDRLLGPGGCPWDREQTMHSSRTYVLEEVCELIEAIDLEDNAHIKEELGDLFFNAIFLSRLAEKEGRCTLEEVVSGITDKLIRRHPHVFEAKALEKLEEVVNQWESIKSQEKGNSHRKSILDGIPKGLPALVRAYKMIRKVKKHHPEQIENAENFDFDDERGLGKLLWRICLLSQVKGIDPEHALRKVLAEEEKAFRDIEKGISQ